MHTHDAYGRSIWSHLGISEQEFYGAARKFVERVAVIQTTDALVGDDRRAPNGDEFETEMLRLMQL